jgi:hypothetical protein
MCVLKQDQEFFPLKCAIALRLGLVNGFETFAE